MHHYTARQLDLVVDAIKFAEKHGFRDELNYLGPVKDKLRQDATQARNRQRRRDLRKEQERVQTTHAGNGGR